MRRAVPIFALCFGFALTAGAEAKIHHKPPKPVADSPLTISATITAPGGVLEASVNYRKGRGEFQHLKMDAVSGDTFEAIIPATYLAGARKLEYFIRAVAAQDLNEALWKSKSSPYRLKLERSGPRKLHVTTTPTGAILDLDGVTIGPSPLKKKVAPGPHKIVARLADYSDLEFPFTMPGDGDLELPLTLKREVSLDTTKQARPLVPGKGRLRLSSVPLDAAITVDGAYSGQTPAEIDLTPEKHLVSTARDGYRDESRVVNIVAGEVVEVVLHLKPTPASMVVEPVAK